MGREMREIPRGEEFILNPHVPGIYSLWITPAMAKEWLEKYNTHNRDFLGIDGYATDFASGNWMFNGDTITFGKDGVMQDGQHRLATCVETRVSFETIVVTGLEPRAQETKDINHVRRTADFLRMEDKMPHPVVVSSIARHVLAYQKGVVMDSWAVLPNGQTSSMAERLAFIRANKGDMLLAAQLAKEVPKSRVKIAGPLLAAAWYICRRLDDDLEPGDRNSVYQAEEFYHDKLLKELHLSEGDPALTLSRRLDSHARSHNGRKMPPRDAFRFTIMAWNAMREGRKIERLQVPPQGWSSRQLRFQ